MTTSYMQADMQAVNAIINSCDQSGLDEIITMIKARRTMISHQTAISFHKGQTVTFDRGPKRGGMCSGKIQKINIKSVKVDVGGAMWNVSPTLLTAA